MNVFEQIAAIIEAAGPPVMPGAAAAAPISAEQKSDPPKRAKRSRALPRKGVRAARPDPEAERERQRGLDAKLAFYSQTDLGNVERFVARNRGRFHYCPAIGWLAWDSRRWSREGADAKVNIAEHETVRAIQDEAAWLADSDQDVQVGVRHKGKADEEAIWMSEALAAWGRSSEESRHLSPIAKHARAYLQVEAGQLDADPYRINALNGTLRAVRARDGGAEIEFTAHDPADLITRLAPVEYDPDAVSPEYDAFLELVQPHAEVRRYLHQWGGYSMTGDTSEQCLTFNWGKGKNGKSTLFNAWGLVLGDYGKSTPIETFLDAGKPKAGGAPSPELASLAGIRYLRTSEPERGAKLAEALIKLVTGSEPIDVRHLNRDFFALLPQFKLTMSGNYKPQIFGTDEGIWRRVKLVPWVVEIPAERRILDFDKVKLKPEASGILNRLLAGLADWLENRLVEPQDVMIATAEYRRDSDALGRFLTVCTAAAEGARVQSSELHRLFVVWARANGEKEWSATGLGKAMRERGFQSLHSNVNWWVGIQLVRQVADFVDHEGNPRAELPSEAGAAEPATVGASSDEVPL